MSDGVKTALSQAVEAHRDQGGPAPQQDLFSQAWARRTELDQAIDTARETEAIVDQAWREAEAEQLQPAGPRPPGRPKGSRNLRTEEAARYYIGRHGDPLEQAVKLGAIPILAKGVLEALAQRLGCTRLEAAKWWSSNNQAVMPYLRPRLGSLEIKPAGSPGSGEAVIWEPWDYIDGELVDGTVSPDKAEAAQETAEQIGGPGAVPE